MFGNLKLRGQLLLGYSIPVLLWIIMASIVYSSANKVFNTFKEFERVETVRDYQTDIMLSGGALVRSFRGYVISETPNFLTEYQTAYNEFKQSSEKLKELIILDIQKERLRKLNEAVEEYNEYVKNQIPLIEQGKRDDARSIFKNNIGKQYVDSFNTMMKEFLDTEQTVMRQKMLATKSDLESMIYSIVFGVILLIIALIVTVSWVSLGLSEKINRMVQSLASSSTEIAATLIQQERNASQQASSVNETTTTVDELGTSARATAEQAEAATVSAKQVLGLAEGGKRTVSNALDEIANLKEKVGAIAQQIMRLSEQTNQIGNISQLVSELANQTNMLALNATVEAVRAGEHGKGFGVVAAEIRKLADESKRSAEKIKTIVADIQSSINTTVMVTDEGNKKADLGLQMASKSSDAFGGVTDAVNNVVLNSQQISLNVKQQAIAINQLVTAMNSINTASRENVESLNQTKQGIENLKETAKDLKSII